MSALHSLLRAAALVSAGASAAAQIRGPSSSQPPYLLPTSGGVTTVAILTAGDTPRLSPGYRMVGDPDGLGAFGVEGNRFTLLMNHELSASQGIVRAHGQIGAFVSEWTIRRSDLAVLKGTDLIRHTHLVSGGPVFARFCSADLAERSAFYPPSDADPAHPRLFLNGEESGTEGRAWAHVPSGPLNGESYELPRLGKANFENQVARPGASSATVVVGLDDSNPGQVYVYIGQKDPAGSFLDRAGLTNGHLYGVRVPGVPLEDRATGIGGQTQFELADLGDVSALTGAQLQAASVAAGVTQFLRPEDGAWDPHEPRRFYFNTTDRFNSGSQVGRSRLWRLVFLDFLQPQLGGAIEMLLDGTEGQQMLDNMAIDAHGNLLLCEDPGNNAHLSSVWYYDVASDSLTRIAQHDPSRFLAGGANYLTQNEECSGVIDASAVLGPGWFLLDSMAHYPNGTELVEGGQLLALFNPASL